MFAACTLLCCLTAVAQRSFVLKNSADGLSELHCFLPEHPTGRAVMACPGGGYQSLSLEKEGTNWAPWFNEQGVAFFTLKYRMPDGAYELPLADAFHAMQTIRDSAQVWSINPEDVGIMGFSAGGHLAATVSTLAPYAVRPNFSILFYPVITMDEKTSHAGSVNHFLATRKTNSVLVRRFSANMNVNHWGTPPAIVLLCSDDRIVPPVTNGIAYYSAMRQAGNPCTLHVYPDGGHGFGFATWFKHREQMLGDLSAWLHDLKTPKRGAVRVACIGNSITRGSCIDMASEQGYPAQLQQLLGDDYYVRNFGMPGYTMMRRADYPYMNTECWQMAQDFRPDIVIIKLGTNDVRPSNWVYADSFAEDAQMMIDSLRSLSSKPQILLATPIPIYTDKGGMHDSLLTQQLIPMIEDIARKNQLELIDLHSVVNDQKMMTGDGIHPNPKGAGVIARTVADAILPKH